MDKLTHNILNIITETYDKCNSNNNLSNDECLMSILDANFCEFKRITFHGGTDIIIKLEISKCTDENRLTDLKTLQNNIKQVDDHTAQKHIIMCQNLMSLKHQYRHNMKTLIYNAPQMESYTIYNQHSNISDNYMTEETALVDMIVNTESNRMDEKKTLLQEFSKKHQLTSIKLYTRE